MVRNMYKFENKFKFETQLFAAAHNCRSTLLHVRQQQPVSGYIP